jgi:hypothetical protein
MSAKEATGGLQGTVSLLGGRVEGAVLPSSSLVVKQLEQGALSIPRVTLQLADPLPFRCELASSRCSAGAASVGIRMPGMSVLGREARLAQGTLVLQQAEAAKATWNIQATVHALGVSVDLPKGGFSPTDWKIQFTANEAGVKADVRADAPAHEAVVTAAIEQSFQSSPGSLHAKVGPVKFDGSKRRLSRLVTGFPVPVDVTDGQLTATVDLSWTLSTADPQHRFRLTSAAAVLTADALSGYYRSYAVNGLTTTARLHTEGPEPIAMLEPASIRIASLETGVDVTNVAMTMQASWKSTETFPVIDLKDIQCDLFGGAATSPGVRLDWAQPSRRITFSLRNLDLGRIVSVEQQKGLQGTGLLNGTVPVTMTGSGLTVEDGVLEAQPPGGVLRYASVQDLSKLIMESDSQLRLVGQALTNFHYTVLRARVQYAETGTLDLSVRLEGRNPDLKTTSPIHVNLTVQEHVPTLLKSLRLVRDIEDALQMKANTL